MKTVKKRSQIQEKSVAKDLNAKVVVASGALWNAKGDTRSDKFLIECKTTAKDYYSITTKVWEKIESEANRDGMRIPLLVVDLRDSDRYVIFNPNHFEAEVNQYEIKSNRAKSFRFMGTEDIYCETLLFSLDAVKSHKTVHMLVAMPIKKFQEIFKEEI